MIEKTTWSSRTVVVALACAFAVGVLTLASCTTARVDETDTVAVRDVPYRELVQRFAATDSQELMRLAPIDVPTRVVPGAGVEVMRATIEETYEVDGVGEDTVKLTGWVAVRRSSPRPVTRSARVGWSNFVMDNQFVALELEGESEVFGPIRVRLDEDRPAFGQIGSGVKLPVAAQQILRDPSAAAAKCRAPVNVVVSMPELELEMRTAEAATWYSVVDTVPPVETEASRTVEPIRLVDGERTVGTLMSGTILFREVVATSTASLENAGRMDAP